MTDTEHRPRARLPPCVGIVVEEGFDLALAMLSCVLSETPFVSIDARWPDTRTQAVTQRCNVQLVIVPRSDPRILPDAQAVTIEELMQWGRATRSASAPTQPEARREAGYRVCYYVPTSGTTGEPKIVETGHAQLLEAVEAKVAAEGLLVPGKVLLAAHFTFDLCHMDLVAALMSGSVVVAPTRAAATSWRLVDVIKARRVTHVCCTPTHWKLVVPPPVAHGPPSPSPAEFPDLRCVSLCGERYPEYLMATDWVSSGNLQVRNTYGLTEGTGYQSTYLVTSTTPQPVPIGRTFGSFKLELRKRRRALPQEEALEIVVVGPGLSRYLGETESPTELWTGDEGATAADGSILVLGRSDGMVKVRGQRVSLEDIDSTVMKAPFVADAASCTMQGGKLGCVAVVRVPVRRGAGGGLPPADLPVSIFPVDTLDRASADCLRQISSDLGASQLLAGERKLVEAHQVALAALCAQVLPPYSVPYYFGIVLVPGLTEHDAYPYRVQQQTDVHGQTEDGPADESSLARAYRKERPHQETAEQSRHARLPPTGSPHGESQVEPADDTSGAQPREAGLVQDEPVTLHGKPVDVADQECDAPHRQEGEEHDAAAARRSLARLTLVNVLQKHTTAGHTSTPASKTNRIATCQLVSKLQHRQRLQADGSPRTPLSTPLEHLVASAWATCLSIPLDAIGALDSFRDLGGDSISALRVVDFVRRATRLQDPTRFAPIQPYASLTALLVKAEAPADAVCSLADILGPHAPCELVDRPVLRSTRVQNSAHAGSGSHFELASAKARVDGPTKGSEPARDSMQAGSSARGGGGGGGDDAKPANAGGNAQILSAAYTCCKEGLSDVLRCLLDAAQPAAFEVQPPATTGQWSRLHEAVVSGSRSVAAVLLEHDAAHPAMQHAQQTASACRLAVARGDYPMAELMLTRSLSRLNLSARQVKACLGGSPGDRPLGSPETTIPRDTERNGIGGQPIPNQPAVDCFREEHATGAGVAEQVWLHLVCGDGDGQSVLHVASRSGSCEMVRLVMDAVYGPSEGKGDWRALLDLEDKESLTAVGWALRNGTAEVGRLLVQRGCCAKGVERVFEGNEEFGRVKKRPPRVPIKAGRKEELDTDMLAQLARKVSNASRDRDDDALLQAVTAVRTICCAVKSHRRYLVTQANIVESLVQCLHMSLPVAAQAAGALRNLSLNDFGRQALLSSSAVAPLAALLDAGPSSEAAWKAAGALAALATAEDSWPSLVESGAAASIIRLGGRKLGLPDGLVSQLNADSSAETA
ncbi:Bacitracin synthase 3 [Diplonema papillatum]|nr:Bacitracin synthase 3 [Diplonema papillatum]